MLKVTRSQLLHYSFAVLTVGLTLGLILLLNRVIEVTESSFLLFFVPIFISALYGGAKPGLLATGLTAFAIAYFFLPPFYSLALAQSDIPRFLFFLLQGILLSALIAIAQTARQKSEATSENLRTSNEQLKLALEAAYMGTWDWNITTGSVTWSENHEVLFGLPPGAFSGSYEAFLNCIHPEDRSAIAHAISDAIESKTDYNEEFRVIWPDGSIHWIAGRGQFFYDALGTATRMIGVIWDVSDRKQAEFKRAQLLEIAQQARWEAEAAQVRITNILGSITDAFVTFDHEWRYTYVNPKAEQLLGKTRSQLIGQRIWDVFPTSFNELGGELARRAVAEQITLTYEEFSPLFNKWLAVRLYPSQEGLSVYFQDITERKQTEEALRNSEQRYRALLEAIPQIVFTAQPNGRCTYVNQQWCHYTGMTVEESQNLGWLKILHPEDLPHCREAWEECQQTGNIFELEYRLRRLDGSYRWHLGRSLPVKDTEGNIYAWFGTCTDIHDQKQLEVLLQQGNQRLRLLSETASNLLSTEQPLTLLTSLFNQLKAQMSLDVYFNYLVDEPKQVMHLASYSGISENIAQTIECLDFGQAVCGTVAQQRCQIVRENVQQLTDSKTELIRSLGIQAYSCQPLIAQGRIFGTLSFGSRSRSHFNLDEIALMQTVCDQIAIAMERARLIDSLQQQAEQLREANRLKDEFLAVVSHELRSPLNSMLGWAQMLRSQKLSDTMTAKAIETIERNARNQKQLIEDLLDVSRIITGKLHLNVRSLELGSILEVAIDSVRPAADAKDISLRCMVDPFMEKVSGDSDRLQQVFWNLLSNAIKFTPQGGQVEVRLEKLQKGEDHLQSELSTLQSEISYAQIAVSDTGIGIKSDFLPYVFERFRQADSSSTRAYGGLGLGLAIVSHLVELHGGTVDVSSPGEGQGATFTVKLPLQSVNNRESDTNIEETADFVPLTPHSSLLAGLRTLVVDDEADTRTMIAMALQTAGAKVKAVTSAQEALEALQQWHPDVLVSDIAMPEADGYALIRQVRSLPAAQGGQIPAIALTAYARVEDRTQALQAGFQMHLSKPIEPAELVRVIANFVGCLN